MLTAFRNSIIMDDTGLFNINEICRGCLSDRKVNLQSIFKADTMQMFVMCTNLQVSQDDGLPANICTMCVYKCMSWYSFKQLCERTDVMLRNQLPSSNQIDETERKEVNVVHNETDTKVTVIDASERIHMHYNEVTAIKISSDHEDGPADLDEPIASDARGYSDGDEASQQQASEIYPEPLVDEKLAELRLPVSAAIKPTNVKSKTVVSCDSCPLTFRNVERMEAHKRTHRGLKPEVCKVCDKEFDNMRALRRHRLKHADTTQYECKECGKTYKYQTSLTLHKKAHQDVRRFVCDACGKAFVRAHGLQSHLLTHSTDTPFPCDECGKRFKNQIMLRNHQLRHDGIKKFACTQCGKAFTTSAELITHNRSHTGIKPFVCTMCPKSYKTKSHLSVHFRSHTGSRPYPCDMCPLKFAHNKVLKQHRLTHTGERPHICDLCNRPFRQKSTLKMHMRTHVKDPPIGIVEAAYQSTDMEFPTSESISIGLCSL